MDSFGSFSPSVSISPLDGIQCLHIGDECIWQWVHSYFSSSFHHIFSVLLEWFVRKEASVVHPPLMMAQSWAESTWEITNYGRIINQFQPNIIRSIRQFERINKKICRQKMSIMFNEICINEEMMPKYTYIYIYVYMYILAFHFGIYIYIYIYTISFKSVNRLKKNNLNRVLHAQLINIYL